MSRWTRLLLYVALGLVVAAFGYLFGATFVAWTP